MENTSIQVMQAVLFGGGIDAPPNALSFVEEADGFPLDSCQRNLRVKSPQTNRVLQCKFHISQQ